MILIFRLLLYLISFIFPVTTSWRRVGIQLNLINPTTYLMRMFKVRNCHIGLPYYTVVHINLQVDFNCVWINHDCAKFWSLFYVNFGLLVTVFAETILTQYKFVFLCAYSLQGLVNFCLICVVHLFILIFLLTIHLLEEGWDPIKLV